jgi:putative transposase
MENIIIASEQRKYLISQMKREGKPSRRLRMHIVLLASKGYSPTEISRTLFCSRTTVYAIVGRFIREGQKAFNDRKRRGPAPLLNGSAQKLIEELTEERLPTERGWLRSRWSCKLLALEMFKERALVVSQETVRRVLHRLGFRWRRPRPVPPPKDPIEKRKRLETIVEMLRLEWSFLSGASHCQFITKVCCLWLARG